MKILKTNAPDYYNGKPVHHNRNSNTTVYEYDGKFYFGESFGVVECDTLEEAVREEAKLDCRLGWN